MQDSTVLVVPNLLGRVDADLDLERHFRAVGAFRGDGDRPTLAEPGREALDVPLDRVPFGAGQAQARRRFTRIELEGKGGAINSRFRCLPVLAIRTRIRSNDTPRVP